MFLLSLMRSWGARRHRGMHFDPTFALIDQVEDIGSRLKPFDPFLARPFLIRVGVWQRLQKTLDKRMPRLFPSTAAFTAASEVLVRFFWLWGIFPAIRPPRTRPSGALATCCRADGVRRKLVPWTPADQRIALAGAAIRKSR